MNYSTHVHVFRIHELRSFRCFDDLSRVRKIRQTINHWANFHSSFFPTTLGDENDENCEQGPTTPTPDNSTYSCPEENGYFADQNNCIKYYICTLGHASHQTCQISTSPFWCLQIIIFKYLEETEKNPYISENNIQLHYDEYKIACEWPENVDCGGRPVCDPNDENCYEATTPPPNYCDTLTCRSGDFIIAEGQCEPCFCECTTVGFAPDEICCSPGLFFNPAAGLCDWPFNNAAC